MAFHSAKDVPAVIEEAFKNLTPLLECRKAALSDDEIAESTENIDTIIIPSVSIFNLVAETRSVYQR